MKMSAKFIMLIYLSNTSAYIMRINNQLVFRYVYDEEEF